MSDNLHIDFQILVYDQFEMAYNGKGELLKNKIQKRFEEILKDELRLFEYDLTGSAY